MLGVGGMATVYLAEDLKHHRQVAIKVMRPELAETLGSERFLREVEIAAKMSHPNILPVYDSGDANGVLYYVMPLVEGESLPDRLAREKQLPVGDALKIAREVAEALAHAHAHGIVHRDIKPANILMHSGHAMVADFGIARATSNADYALTQTGLAIGTPQYMSPEQSSGDHNLDGRTDIYALGCVLYEMLAGEPPFTGPTAQAIISRSITDTARPLQQTRPSIAPMVSTVVTTAIAKAPADRYANASDMANAIINAEDQTRFGSGSTDIKPAPPRSRSRWAAAAVIVILLGLGGVRYLSSRASASTARSVAVLPFVNQGSADQAYIADGIVDELRDRLSRLEQLTVTASASADQYKATTKSSAVIAKELGVDQLLMGKVSWRLSDNGKRQLHVVTELVNGHSGDVTWRNSFDADSGQVTSIQGRIATSVATALGTAVHADQAKSLAGRPTQNAEAYDLYLKARAVRSNSASDVRSAANYYEQAVALDSNFARAWGGLSINLSLLYANGTRDSVVGHRAKEALDKLLKLANDSAGAHDVAATYYTNVPRDLATARRETARALQLDSNDISALMNSASDDLTAGRYKGTFDKLTRARKINPRAKGPLNNLMQSQLFLGQYDDAVRSAVELTAMQPTDPSTLEWIALAYVGQGDTVSARRFVQETLKRVPATELVAYFAGYQELAFLLGPAELDLLFRMTPAAFDNDRAWWAQTLATAHRQHGDLALARAYADSALAASKQQSDANPDDPQLRSLYAVMLAYSGHAADASREIERAAAGIKPDDPTAAYYMLQQARVYLANGANDKAMDVMDKLLKTQYYVTRGYLKMEPMFKQLRGNPRFEKMLVAPITTTSG